MATRWVDFTVVRQRVTLEMVIFELYGIANLKRTGTKLVGPCPVHGGDSPRAFHAELSRNIWHCFSGCQGGGNQIDFVAKKEGITIRQAALKLMDAFMGEASDGRGEELKGDPRTRLSPIQEPEPPQGESIFGQARTTQTRGSADSRSKKRAENADLNDGSASPANPPLNVRLKLKHDHPHLIEKRQLSPTTIRHFGIGWCGRGIMKGCIAIPIHDENGTLVAYAGRRLKPQRIRELGKYKFPKGFRKDVVLFNLHRANEHAGHGELVLVEGFFSVFTLQQAGVPNVVASMGCALSSAQARLIADSSPSSVLVLYDGNDSGRVGATAARATLGELGVPVRVAWLPDDLEPDDLGPRMLRWLCNGMRELDLRELRFEFAASEAPKL